jgi:hypothetical protein
MLAHNLVLQRRIRLRIDVVQRGSEHGNGAAASRKGRLMRRGVNTLCQTTDNDNSTFTQP